MFIVKLLVLVVLASGRYNSGVWELGEEFKIKSAWLDSLFGTAIQLSELREHVVLDNDHADHRIRMLIE